MTSDLNLQSILQKSTPIECQGCTSSFFTPCTILRKISGIHLGQSMPSIVPVNAFRCMDCGEILKEVFPEGMADLEEKYQLTKVTKLSGVIHE